MKTILSIRNLNVYYSNKHILKDIELNLKQNQILGIIGESGCGKSTLLQTIIQLFKQKNVNITGKIIYKQKNLLNADLSKIRGKEIGMIFQDTTASLPPITKISKQFIDVLQTHKTISKKEALKEALSLLRKLNFDEPENILNKYPFELSGGMNQRIAIALSMILKPKILLIDEPTSGLDMIAQRQFINEMLYIKDVFNISIIFVTHDIDLIREISDELAVMYQGEVVDYGENQYIINQLKHSYSKKLLLNQ